MYHLKQDCVSVLQFRQEGLGSFQPADPGQTRFREISIVRTRHANLARHDPVVFIVTQITGRFRLLDLTQRISPFKVFKEQTSMVAVA